MGTHRRKSLAFGLTAATVLAVLVILNLRRPPEAETWMAAQRQGGEKFTLEELGIHPPVATNHLLQDVLEESTGTLKQMLAGGTRSSAPTHTPLPGTRRSLLEQDAFESCTGSVLDWGQAATNLAPFRPVLRRIAAATLPPPAASSFDPFQWPGQQQRLDFVAMRSAAQALHDAALLELHQGNHEAAAADLVALLRLARSFQEDGWLLTQMIRVAVLGLAESAVWEASCIPGWTDSQLAGFQAELEAIRVLAPYRRCLEIERAMAVKLWFEALDGAPPGKTNSVSAYFNSGKPAEKFGYALWRTLWSDADLLYCLQWHKDFLGEVRAVEAGGAAAAALRAMDLFERRAEQRMRRPLARLRFLFSATVNSPLSRASRRVFQVECGRRACVVALACARYHLAEGHYPDSLELLTPRFLAELQKDPLDGAPLRYRPQPGGFLLYSVGEDGRDDGGDPTPLPPAARRSEPTGWGTLTWDGRDAVWPQAAVGTHPAAQRP